MYWLRNKMQIFLVAFILFLLSVNIKALAAPSSDVKVIAEYGTVNLVNNTYQTINLANTYTNLVVVASVRYAPTGDGQRTARVRNKGAGSFEIKVDNFSSSFTGSTTVDWIAMEAGDFEFDNGVDSTRVIAGTENVSQVVCRGNFPAGGTTVNFSPSFSSSPAVIHTVSSENDATWVTSTVNDGVTRGNPATASTMALALQRSFDTCTHSAEDIDYVAMEINHGTHNSVEFESILSPDVVACCNATGDGFNFATSFSSTPLVTIVAIAGEDGGDGGYAIDHTGTPTSTTQFFSAVDEEGPGANRTHTTEQVSLLAFAAASGEIEIASDAPGGILNGLLLWLKADDLVGLSDGDFLDTWSDSGTLGNDLVQTGALRPNYRDNSTDNINFNPVIDFDGVDDFVEDADGENYLNGEDEISAFWIVEADSTPLDVGFFRTDTAVGADSGLSIRYDLVGADAGGIDSIKFGDGSDPENTGEGSSNSQTTEPHMLSLLRSTGTIPELYIYGKADVYNNTPGNSLAVSGLDYVRVGDHGKGVWDGSVAEVILYDSKFSNTDRNKVESYLGIKYGITLDQTVIGGKDYIDSAGAVVWDASDNGAYNNDIAGIGEDEASGLDKIQSKSVNDDAIVTIASAVSLDDNEFLFWANDNGSTAAWSTSEAPSGVQRLPREWHIDELLDDTGEVVVSVAASDLPATGKNIGLFLSDDSDFSDASNLVAMVNNSGIWQATVNLEDGQFFTFAFADQIPPEYVFAEFGTASLTDNNYLQVNLTNEYANLVVVASPRYQANAQPQRSVRVRTKTSNSFEIKVDNFDANFTGATTVDWLVMEAGEHLMATDAGILKVIAGTQNTSVVSCNGSFPLGTLVTFSKTFDSLPVVLHTISSENDTSWVASSVNNGSQTSVPQVNQMFVTMQRVFGSCTHGAEDIDYIAFDALHSLNNSIEFESVTSASTVACCVGGGYSVDFASAFSSAPSVTLVSQATDNGINGGYAITHTGTATSTTQHFTSIDEDGPGADRSHTTEQVYVVAFAAASGELKAIAAPGGVEHDLQLWLKADAGVNLSGSDVDSWFSQDQSPEIFSPPDAKPVLNNQALNFRPIISFSNGGLLASGQLLTNDLSYFSIASNNSASTGAVFEFRNSDDTFISSNTFNRTGSPNILNVLNRAGGVAQDDSLAFSNVSFGDYYISSNLVSGNASTFLINGSTDFISTVLDTKGISGAAISADVAVGMNIDNANVLQGNIPEMALFNRSLITTERQQVESYIAIKYALTLAQSPVAQNYIDSSARIIWDATANTGFDNDIAALANDEAAELLQNKAKSINSDAILTVDINATNGDLDDHEFIFWSNDNDDNGLIEITSSGLPSGLAFRLDRSWRISETGDVGTIDLDFDILDTGIPGDVNDLKLIVDTDTDFTTGATIVNATLCENGVLEFDDVSLVDGNIITVATTADDGENQLFWGMPY